MTLKDLLFVILQVFLLLIFISIPGGKAAVFGIQLFAFVLVVSGAILTAAAMIQLGPGLTPLPRPREKAQLITSGLYKYIRHPVYTGLLAILAGISVYSLNLPRAIVTLMLVILFYYKSRYEEKLLIQRFRDYELYKSRTGRFLPSFRKKNNTGY